MRGEARDVRELHALHLAIPAARLDGHRARGRVQRERRHRLSHRQHARLEEDGDGADGVRSGHRRIVGGLHDDQPRVAIGPGGRRHEVHAQRGLAPRLEQEPAPQLVAVRLEVALPLEHGRARRRQHTADDHVVVLPADVAADHRHRALPPHRSILSAAFTPTTRYVFKRGSSTSRSPSPSRFIASTVSMIASPGKVEIHHASRR